MPELALFTDPTALGAAVAAARKQGKRIGLVPTMGNLHAGHVSLVTAAREHCEYVVATLFVNPLQFGPTEDLAQYPRTFQADKEALQAASCDALFAPDAATMYPHGLGAHTKISVPQVSTLHCGKSRPGHFDGVCTVVCKLFNMAAPDHAFFGLKDFQQFHILSRMVDDLRLPLRMHGLATVREASGLALSSRNGYLSASERAQAPALYATLRDCARTLEQGNRAYGALEATAAATLTTAGLRPDYIHICSRATLLPAAPQDSELVILAAAWCGTTRLIDNILVKVPAAD
jgi:pantoate--beta-alanine ligase